MRGQEELGSEWPADCVKSVDVGGTVSRQMMEWLPGWSDSPVIASWGGSDFPLGWNDSQRMRRGSLRSAWLVRAQLLLNICNIQPLQILLSWGGDYPKER